MDKPLPPGFQPAGEAFVLRHLPGLAPEPHMVRELAKFAAQAARMPVISQPAALVDLYVGSINAPYMQGNSPGRIRYRQGVANDLLAKWGKAPRKDVP